MKKEFHDKDLGKILLQANPRAKRYSIRIRGGTVVAVIPPGGDEQTMLNFIQEKKEQVLEGIAKSKRNLQRLDDASEMQTNTFRLHIFCTEREHFYMNLLEGVLHIACPLQTDFADERVQQLLKSLLEKALRHEAKRVLPARLKSLADVQGFTYAQVRIAYTKSRWGSCSSRRNINLSIALMLLPDRLVNYVLLHELCHTVEMNHSPRFWNLMNKVTGNKALELRKELKTYNTSF